MTDRMEIKIADYQPPLSLTIPIPHQRERAYGVNSTTYDGARRFYVRLNPAETKAIEEAAALLDIPVATFMQSLSVAAAEAVKGHYNAYLKSREGG